MSEKITNEMKYKTPDERNHAFNEWCSNSFCESCKLKAHNFYGGDGCRFYWLALEAEEEKLEPCPFCGGECLTSNAVGGMWRVYCEKDMTCLYSSGTFLTEAEAIAAHNRVARAVRAAKESEEWQ